MNLREGNLSPLENWLAIAAVGPGTLVFLWGTVVLLARSAQAGNFADALFTVFLIASSFGLAALCGAQLVLLLFRVREIEFRETHCALYFFNGSNRIVELQRFRFLCSASVFDWRAGRRSCAVFLAAGNLIVIAEGMNGFADVVAQLKLGTNSST